MEEKNAFQIID